MTRDKPVLAIDIDDVLAATTQGVLAYATGVLGKSMHIGDIKRVDYWLAYGLSDAEAIDSVQGYNEAGFPGLLPIDGAQRAIAELARVFSLHAVTARDRRVSAATIDWLDRHFAGHIDEVHFVGNKFVSDTIVSKAIICHRIGANVAIDDDPEHIGDYVEQGIKAIVYGDHTWQDYGSMPNESIRCRGWEDVCDYLKR